MFSCFFLCFMHHPVWFCHTSISLPCDVTCPIKIFYFLHICPFHNYKLLLLLHAGVLWLAGSPKAPDRGPPSRAQRENHHGSHPSRPADCSHRRGQRRQHQRGHPHPGRSTPAVPHSRCPPPVSPASLFNLPPSSRRSWFTWPWASGLSPSSSARCSVSASASSSRSWPPSWPTRWTAAVGKVEGKRCSVLSIYFNFFFFFLMLMLVKNISD